MESLRLLPPVPMTFRQAGKTDYIEGVLVPKGTMLYIPVCTLISLVHEVGYIPNYIPLDQGCQHLEGNLGRRRRGVR